jgi:hypothetical protein
MIGRLRLGYLAMALLAVGQGGCLLVAAGVAGGATAAYLYHSGKVCRIYNAAFADAIAATRTALGELGMEVTGEEQSKAGEAFLESRTADGERVRIYLDLQPSKFPAEGALTRICVRVATFGDHPVSNRILDQVSAHLVPANMLAVPPPVLPAQPTAPPQPTPLPAPRPLDPPAQTAPPPLAP